MQPRELPRVKPPHKTVFTLYEQNERARRAKAEHHRTQQDGKLADEATRRSERREQKRRDEEEDDDSSTIIAAGAVGLAAGLLLSPEDNKQEIESKLETGGGEFGGAGAGSSWAEPDKPDDPEPDKPDDPAPDTSDNE